MLKNAIYNINMMWLAPAVMTLLTACGAPPDVKKILEDSQPDDPFSLVTVINTGLAYTTSTSATLYIAATNSPTEMYITNDSTCASGGTTEPFANSKSITLTSNSLNTIYVKVGDGTIESLCVSAKVTHDNINPTLAIVAPLASQYANLTNVSSFPIGGTCSESGSIQISGSASGTATCSGGTWNTTVNLTSAGQGAVSLSAVETDLAGLLSTTQTVNFQKDTVAPTSPSVSINSNAAGTASLSTTLTLATTGATQMYITNTAGCTAGGAYETYATSKTWTLATANATNTVYVKFKDVAGNETACVNDSIIHSNTPPTLTFATPSNGTWININNKTAFAIGGTCSGAGQNVVISGSANATVVCTSGVWSTVLNLTSASDGTNSVTLNVDHSSFTGVAATQVQRQFSKDTIAPASPSLSINSNAISTSTLSVTLTLSAIGASEMYITNTAGCASGGNYETYATSKSWMLVTADASNTVYVKYKDTAGNETACLSDSIIHSVIPPTLTFVSPTNGTWINLSNQNAFAIGGACSDNGQNVVVSGDGSATVTCTSGAWSAAVNLTALPDGTNSVTLNANHSSASGLSAPQVQRQFSKDTVVPATPAITLPTLFPHTSSGSTLGISGTCESGATVTLSGAETGTTTCTSGNFSLSLNKSVDGTYNYQLTQTDAASNTSSALSFTWTRDSSTPVAPTITLPAVAPAYTNSSTITVSGTCVTGYTVKLTGDLVDTDIVTPAGQLSQICTSGTFSYVVQKLTDGAYTHQVTQTNLSDITSPASQVVWFRDSANPSAPAITTPATSPYTSGGNLTISGACETNATVYLTGSSTQNVVCANSAYSFSVVKSTDATYNFTLSQTDRAGNTSTTVAQQWVRNSSALPAPVITIPSATPLTSNSTSLTLSGTCTTGYTVTLATGAISSEVTTPANSLTQTCTGGNFTYVIAKSTDGTYNFTVTQTDGFTTSPADNQQWVRDTTPPNTTLTANPLNPNPRFTAAFTFTSTEAGSTFQCRYDSGSWTSCTSPASLSPTNATHTYDVRAIDAANNVDPTPASFTWVQQAYNTLALYKFTSGSDFTDNSSYTSTLNNPLTNSGSVTTALGKFGNGRVLTAASFHKLTAADSNSLNTTDSQMTVELWVKHTSLPAGGDYQVYLSKSSTTANNIGWEFGVKRQGSNYRLYFSSSVNAGATRVEVVSGSNCGLTTTSFAHVAVTWNKGSIAFYCNGAANGTGTNGTIGSAVLNQSTAALQIGAPVYVADAAHLYFDGTIDDVRISQIVRWTTTFTPPAASYTAD